MIERAQFRLNDSIYVENAFPQLESNESFFHHFLHEIECVHARARRYTSPDEHPFTSDLPEPLLPPLSYPKELLHAPAAEININAKVMNAYLQEIVKALCQEGDDGNHGSAATRDVECLQAISRRIHYGTLFPFYSSYFMFILLYLGKFIAEAKFRDPKTHDIYIKHIRAQNRLALYALLTNAQVEANVLERLRKKAQVYGMDFNEMDAKEGSVRANKVDVDVIVGMYGKWVIPLTKEVEVEYLLHRLEGIDTKGL